MGEPKASAEFLELCDLIHRVSGIKLDNGKRQLVRSRLSTHLRESGDQSLADYMARLRDDRSGSETSMLVDLISTNVTSFFREQHHFEHLAGTVLEERHATGRSDVFRAWSAASSSGEEPYSIAMTLAQALGSDKLRRFLILATDISTRMVERAEQGSFDMRALATVRPERRNRWFDSDGDGGGRVKQGLRDRVRARHLNLMGPWPMKKRFDVIFCRNVLIYFDQPTIQRLIHRFHDQLEPGGYLYIGHSESLSQIEHPFEYAGPTIYRRPHAGLP